MSKAKKKCRVCRVILTADNAYLSRKRNTFQSSCKKCGSEYRQVWVERNRKRERERARKYYQANKNKLRVTYDRSRVIRKYGLTPEEIKNMKEAQGGKCAICRNRLATHVDHCHDDSKHVRGILCLWCNSGIGMLGDDSDLLRTAAQYLEKAEHGKH